jgi:hypothetical protein
MNKRKKVAWQKHRVKAKKRRLQRKQDAQSQLSASARSQS